MVNRSSISRIRWPHPLSIVISSSQLPLLSVTPVWCMDTANFINVKVWVCYSLSKHNVFSMKAKESFIAVWSVEEFCLENLHAFLRLDFQKLSHFHFVHKDNAIGAGKVAEVLYCYYSRDSCEIVRKLPGMEVTKFTNRNQTFWDILPSSPRRRFRKLRPAKV